jgi:hypothetical protein
MATYVLVRHKVRDYSAWKPVYDAHLSKRAQAGLTEEHLLRGASDANEVVILFRAAELARAKAFAESTDLRETMTKAGVVDRPDIYFLTS